MSRVVHFEIQAENPERAMTFYEALFDWKFSQWGDQKYWLITTGEKSAPGIDGGLLPRPSGGGPLDGAHVNAFVCTVDVEDLDAKVGRAVTAGALQVVPKMAIPTVGWLAYCKDTEGNIFGMMQMDAKAK
jgi:predicted enzyme related to lactoylglutathione lyase